MGLLLTAPPAVALDPSAARAEAVRLSASTPRMAAEMLLLANDAEGSLRVLRESPQSEDPRVLRLLADAHLGRRDGPSLRQSAQALSRFPQWRHWAQRRTAQAIALKWGRWMERVGLGLFALGLALLGIGGARALLVMRVNSVAMAAATVVAMLLMARGAPRLVPMVALIGSGMTALVHAASAAVDRTRPDARGRLLAVALVGLASGGLVMSIVVQISIPTLLGLIGER
ncbi:MAG: hypothetical protein AAFV29_16430 [Myxococcota bacterium]